MSTDVPTPQAIFEMLVAYQRSAALVGALELDLFTAIGAGARDTAAIAARCEASERGIRALADYLVVAGLLEKAGEAYTLTAQSSAFLDRSSPRYMGSVSDFLNSPELASTFADVAATVRRGGPPADDATTAPEHAVWAKFARGMQPMIRPQALALAEDLERRGILGARALDIAAGHGLYGIALARRDPALTLVAQDWPAVLEVARENAEEAGVAERFEELPGDAFSVELGGPYDVVLIPNFLHHFDRAACEGFLRKVRAALAPGGHVVALESPPEENRIAPPQAASFAFVMLATTPGGDAYTQSDYRAMFQSAGFGPISFDPLPESMQTVVTAPRDKLPAP